jgi:hypothetical protein
LLKRKGTRLKRFGLVTTNSITQVFNRRVVERHLSASAPISIVMAIGDHPWTKATEDAASVRIAMTVGVADRGSGLLREVVKESGLDTDEPNIAFRDRDGHINADLTVGADLTSCATLLANEGIACNGMMLAGRGFVLSKSEAEHLLAADAGRARQVIRKYINGGELVRSRSYRYAIDLLGYDSTDVRDKFPSIYHHLLSTVKIERDKNRRPAFRKRWWIFGEPRKTFRPALKSLNRYIGTTETAKHRIFQFLDGDLLPDHMIIAIASADPFHLGVLSSRIHVVWALRAGGWLGVGNDPRYSKSRCFDPFPFPDPDPLVRARIADIAERLDKHRKEVQAAHPEITLTQMYNVLEKVRAEGRPSPVALTRDSLSQHGRGEMAGNSPSPLVGEGGRAERSAARTDGGPLRVTAPTRQPAAAGLPHEGGGGMTEAERRIFDDALILILKELHGELDAAVAEAYGWPVDLSDEEILSRLVALNKERAAEEAKGHVRWLRPDYQIPRFGSAKEKAEQIEAELAPVALARTKPAFPSGAVEQTAAVMAALAAASAPLSAGELAQAFKQGRKVEARISATLASLARTGFIAVADGGKKFAIRRAA